MCIKCEKEPITNAVERKLANTLFVRKWSQVRAVKIELMDTEAYNEVDNLQVILFEDDAKNVVAGEHVVITGKKYALQASKSGGLFYDVLYAYSIKYLDREIYELSLRDIERVKKFVRLAKEEPDPKTKKPKGEDNIIERLVHTCTARDIVWSYDIKEALLYVQASAGPDRIGKGSSNRTRKRINGGIVGNAGLGKSMKVRIIQRHDERNRYVSGQLASGKSITAIVSKESERQHTNFENWSITACKRSCHRDQ